MTTHVSTPPIGYQRYTPDPDAPLGKVARGLATAWLFTVGILGALVWFNQEHYTLDVLAVALAITVVHELVHALVGHALGLRVTAGVDFAGLESGPYILPYGTLLTRRESALLAAAPMLVLTPVLLLLIVLGGPTTALAALAALFVNTLGAVSDLEMVVTTVQLPIGVLEYSTAEGDVRYYAPVNNHAVKPRGFPRFG